MRWLGIALLVIFFFVSVVLKNKSGYENQNKEDGVVKQPQYYLSVGILGVVCFVVIAVIFFVQKDIAAGIFMAVVAIPYIILIFYARNWKIIFNESEFVFVNLFNTKRRFSYSEVKIVNTGRGLRVYDGEKKVLAVSFLVGNVDEFYRQYSKFCKKDT